MKPKTLFALIGMIVVGAVVSAVSIGCSETVPETVLQTVIIEKEVTVEVPVEIEVTREVPVEVTVEVERLIERETIKFVEITPVPIPTEAGFVSCDAVSYQNYINAVTFYRLLISSVFIGLSNDSVLSQDDVQYLLNVLYDASALSVGLDAPKGLEKIHADLLTVASSNMNIVEAIEAGNDSVVLNIINDVSPVLQRIKPGIENTCASLAELS